MSSEGHLHQALGTAPPAGLDVLADADRERLATMVDDARHAQRAALSAAIDGGLAKLPRLVRIAVAKVLR